MPLSLSDLDYDGRESEGKEKRVRGKGIEDIKWMMVDGADGRGGWTERQGVCVCTCWSSVFGEPGPCWGLAERECVYAGESVCARVGWQEDWRSQRSPARESSQSRWLTSHCGSDSGAYPPPHLLTLHKDGNREKCHILLFYYELHSKLSFRHNMNPNAKTVWFSGERITYTGLRRRRWLLSTNTNQPQLVNFPHAYNFYVRVHAIVNCREKEKRCKIPSLHFRHTESTGINLILRFFLNFPQDETECTRVDRCKLQASHAELSGGDYTGEL